MKARLAMIAIISSICWTTSKAWAQEGGGPQVPATLIFAGSGSNLAITGLLAEAFMRVHPEIRIEVPASIGSKGGVRAAADGAITVGLISRPLKDEEEQLGLTVRPYARTPVVIAVHPTVTEDAITSEDLIAIHDGTKSRWRGGREIIVLSREPGDSAIQVLQREVPGFRKAYVESQQARRWTTLFTDQEMNQVLEKTPYAIGVSDMGTIMSEHLGIKILKFNGVYPTLENIQNGKYPLVKPLAFVYLKDKLPKEAKAFLDYVRSSEGAQILATNGCLPFD